jgi:UPF0716 protein FxsA
MFLRLLLLFTIVPLVELFILIKLGGVIGVGPTVAIVIGTGILGAWLARRQGLGVLRRLGAELDQGRLPTEALLDGLLILIAGALLLTPGLITDALGFTLLVPPGRKIARRLVKAAFLRGKGRADPSVIDVAWRRGE